MSLAKCNDFSQVVLLGDALVGGGRVWDEINDTLPDKEILGDIGDEVLESDILFLNYEGVLISEGEARDKGMGSAFSLGTDPAVLDLFSHEHVNILSFANNHSADFGVGGLSSTQQAISAAEHVSSVGIGNEQRGARKPVIVGEVTRVAFIAFTDLLPEIFYATTSLGVAKMSETNIRAAVRDAKAEADLVIVSLHTSEAVADTYTYLPDEHQKRFAQYAIDAGADIVVGQHPHGLQRFEVYKDKLIFHSLGLFLYDPAVSDRYEKGDPLYGPLQFKGGGLVQLDICDGTIADFSVKPIQVVEKGGRLHIQNVFSLKAFWDMLRAKSALYL